MKDLTSVVLNAKRKERLSSMESSPTNLQSPEIVNANVDQPTGLLLRTEIPVASDVENAPSKSSLSSMSEMGSSFPTDNGSLSTRLFSNCLTTVSESDGALAIAAAQANAITSIASFLGGLSLPQVLQQQMVAGTMHGAINGLMSHEGRKGLDPRLMTQNSLEMSYLVEGLIEHLLKKANRPQAPLVDAEKQSGMCILENPEEASRLDEEVVEAKEK